MALRLHVEAGGKATPGKNFGHIVWSSERGPWVTWQLSRHTHTHNQEGLKRKASKPGRDKTK